MVDGGDCCINTKRNIDNCKVVGERGGGKGGVIVIDKGVRACWLERKSNII